MLFSTREAAQVLLLSLTIISRYLGAFFACFSLPCLLLCCQSFIATISASVHIHTQIPCHSSWDTFILFTFLFMQQLLSASPLRHVQMHSNRHSVIIFLFFFSSSLPDNSTFFCSSPHQFHISANPKPNSDTHRHRQLLQPLWQLEREDDTQQTSRFEEICGRKRKRVCCLYATPSHHRLPACLPGLAKFLCEQMLPNWFYCRPHRERKKKKKS